MSQPVSVQVVLPSLVRPSDGYILNRERGWVSIIKPVARTNLVEEPSFELALTNWVALNSAVLARVATFQYHGVYSLQVTPAAGVFSGVSYTVPTTLVSGTIYAYSLKFLGTAGLRYKLCVENSTNTTEIQSYAFTATGKWQWLWMFHKSTASLSRTLTVRKNSQANLTPFYIDGVQLEVCAAGEVFASTYIDGDQLSLLPVGQYPPAYGWNGTPHNSTSYRSAQTRDGGQVLNLDAFKLYLTGVTGLGVPDLTHLVATQPYTDGADYLTSIVPSRAFRLSTRLNTSTPNETRRARQELGDALSLHSTTPRQQVALLYQEYDGVNPVGDPGKIVASYRTGLGGNWANNVGGDDIDLSFTQWHPHILGYEAGTTITQNISVSVSDVVSLMYRNAAGTWSVLSSTGVSDIIRDIVRHPDGTYYITGLFTSLGGTAANSIARYDPVTNTFSSLGTGLAGGSALGYGVRVAPNGDVYVCGNFTTAGGVTCNNVARWDGSWHALNSGATKGVNGAAFALTVDAAGAVFFTGAFTQAGGAAAVRIVKYTPSSDSFTALGTGLDNDGTAILATPDSLVYVSGFFANANGVAAAKIAAWNGTTFVALGSGVDGAGQDLDLGPDGAVYVCGAITTAGGLTVNCIARWNGFSWTSLGGGVAAGATVYKLLFASDGLLYFTGTSFTAVAGVPVSDSFAMWTGSSYLPLDLDMPGTTTLWAIAGGFGAELLVGIVSSVSGTALAAALNTLTNDGTAPTYAVFTLTGPSSGTSRLFQIKNYTTGRVVAFNLVVNTLERITIKTSPFGTQVLSNFRGDISALVLQGSAADFPLVPGANSVAFFATGSALTTTARWQKQYVCTEDLVY